MTDEHAEEVPEGAAVFPLIPPELGVDPLLLATLHAVVFLDGSTADVVHGAAASESLEYIATYIQRLDGRRLQRAREDMASLVALAREEKWHESMIRFLSDFLDDFGAGTGDED